MTSSKDGKPVVVSSKDEFDKLVADTGDTLMVVDFYATWCGPCKQIAPKLEALAKENPDVLFVKVDVDEQGEVAEACQISAMPTFGFYKNGKKVHSFQGASEAKLMEAIAKYK